MTCGMTACKTRLHHQQGYWQPCKHAAGDLETASCSHVATNEHNPLAAVSKAAYANLPTQVVSDGLCPATQHTI